MDTSNDKELFSRTDVFSERLLFRHPTLSRAPTHPTSGATREIRTRFPANSTKTTCTQARRVLDGRKRRVQALDGTRRNR